MNRISDTLLLSSFGEPSPELAPVSDFASLNLADLQSARVASADDLSLGGILSDALFGEVIDISDLIPRLSPEAEASVPASLPLDVTVAAEAGVADGGELLAVSGHAAALTIFYDDDLLASVSAIL